MRPFAGLNLFALTILLFALPANADSTWTVRADSTMDGNAGYILQIVESGFTTVDFFTFEEDGKGRAYGFRPEGTDWFVFADPQYLVPLTTISAGMTWRFIGDDDLDVRNAEAITLEAVSNGAGDFLAWRVDVDRPGDPIGTYNSYWFAEGVGLVREAEYEGFLQVWENNLDTYSVTGSGYFPTVVGNVWTYVDSGIPTLETSVGSVKSRYSK